MPLPSSKEIESNGGGEEVFGDDDENDQEINIQSDTDQQSESVSISSLHFVQEPDNVKNSTNLTEILDELLNSELSLSSIYINQLLKN